MSSRTDLMSHSILQLRLRQLWPQKNQSASVIFILRFIASLIVTSHFWVGLLLHLIVVLKNDLDVGLSADISVLCSVWGLHIMLIGFVSGHKKIAHLFSLLDDFKNFGKPDNFDQRINKLNFYSRIYAAYCFFGSLVYILIKTLEIPECRKLNQEKNLNEVCGLIVPVWFPFNVDFFPIRETLLLCQFHSVLMVICGGAIQSFTTYEVASCIVLQINHFKRLLQDYINNYYDNKREKFHFCIRYHQHIISLQDIFDSRYKYPNGAYVLMVGIVIAGLLNQFMKEDNFGALIHLGGWIFSFFICCHAGQMIITESSGIPHAIYDSKWYETPADLQRDLLFIILRSQRDLQLHAAPIGVMSYELYITLVKTSSSYFALLNHST